MGTSSKILSGLKEHLTKMNPDVESMCFYDLPFRDVQDFDYPAIARMVEEDKADIIWVALGAPKQEIFMNLLKPHLKHGVMIAVGAAFKFYSGVDTKRAPKWMVKHHLEFVHRIFCEPKKQNQAVLGNSLDSSGLAVSRMENQESEGYSGAPETFSSMIPLSFPGLLYLL